MAGGLALGLGNLVSQYAWVFAGLSVTNIICSSMTVVIGTLLSSTVLCCIYGPSTNFAGYVMIEHIFVSGTTMNYFLDGRINRAEILFPGVACFLIAVFLGAAVHSSSAKDDEQKLSTYVRKPVSSPNE